jgi:phosphoglycerate dehydrogenase-like enzyme
LNSSRSSVSLETLLTTQDEPLIVKVICVLPVGHFATKTQPFPPEWDVTIIHRAEDLSDELLDGAVAVITTTHIPIRAAQIERMKSVRLIQQASVGYDSLDLDAARRMGMPVANTPGANDAGVAEHVIMAAIWLLRRTSEAIARCLAGENPMPDLCHRGCYEARGRTLGLIGYGAIGREVAPRARAMGMEVLIASAPYREQGQQINPENEPGVQRVTFDQLLRQSDVVSIHVPKNEQTLNLIGAAELARMKPGACFINTSRGGIVDEQALAEALHSGRLAGAAVDVFSKEPFRLDNPLNGAPNALITPHAAGTTTDSVTFMLRASIENVKRVSEGLEPIDRVD